MSKKMLVALLVVALVVLLSACGGGVDTTTPTTAQPAVGETFVERMLNQFFGIDETAACGGIVCP